MYRCMNKSSSKTSHGTFEMQTGTYDDRHKKKITIGFEPKFLAVVTNGATGSESNAAEGSQRFIYDEDFSTTYYHRALLENSTPYLSSRLIGQNIGINSIESDGFVFLTDPNNTDFANATYYYFAIG